MSLSYSLKDAQTLLSEDFNRKFDDLAEKIQLLYEEMQQKQFAEDDSSELSNISQECKTWRSKFSRHTFSMPILVGADITHSGLGESTKASIAVLCDSMDAKASR
nr:13660_t:CDS:2 [Entrophospora candida]